MSEKEDVFSSKVKYGGIFSFKDFYKFCYEWLSEEIGLSISENKYVEKITGTSKEIEVQWSCSKKVTDYFKFEAKVNFRISGLTEVEVMEGNAKVKTNKGSIEIGVKGTLVRDYDGKFETTPFKKFLREVYEKWVIGARIEQFEDKFAGQLDEFLAQSKAYLDLEGKR